MKASLLSKAEIILKEYQEQVNYLINRYLFPVISNQKMNTYVKEIMKAAKGEKAYYFSFRETHFCHAVTNWVPIETVSKLLEHTELSTTQIYARVMENKISGDKSMLEKTMAKKNKKILNL